ncbi:MAG: hypothetical protein GWO41_10800 [candidate division Zixibacteria bacterium]|nr:hypothetical protein [candidate division Zixibacteria bacterium]NIR64623.1 hypothetical protein [candidate division Zixibacteria bacterium]NIS46482.1 hypothetical protein [candidate division Zixibacteria bacterium]NIT53205.1 hypothetical protein [candidate division Zixibacteria bacterium]NIU14607.1 hypothetical protein [candidate division Zixibacteria bacterium]
MATASRTARYKQYFVIRSPLNSIERAFFVNWQIATVINEVDKPGICYPEFMLDNLKIMPKMKSVPNIGLILGSGALIELL